MISYLIGGLVALAILAYWHITLRRALIRSADAGKAMAQAAYRLDCAAVLLANTIRAKQPSDELHASRQLLDALDLAAAYMRETLGAELSELPPDGESDDDGSIKAWLATGDRPDPEPVGSGDDGTDLRDLFGDRGEVASTGRWTE